MRIITLDFESFYDQNYSLSKLTTEEYIRDPRFEIIGVGISVGEEKPKFFTGSHAALRTKLLEYEMHSCAVLSHHAHFDMAILNWILDIRPKLILDTLSMARGLHGTNVGNSLAKLGERYNVGVKGHEVNDAKGKRLKDFTRDEMRAYGNYCENDVAMTYKLFKCMADRYTKDELKIIDRTVRMFTEPVFRVDRPLLEKHIVEVRARKEKLLADSGVTKKELMSNEKFAELLRGYNIEPPMKVSKTTGLDAYAFAKTDDGFKELLEHDDVRVQILAAARVGNKSTLEETRTQRLIDIGKRGLLPVPLLYCGAHTTRWSGCLVADTQVIVYNLYKGLETKNIVDVLLDDLVWDGEEFVEHEGVSFSGYAEVIEWDGVKGTEDHVVYTDTKEISLREAMQGENNIKIARSPNQDDMDKARQSLSSGGG